MTSAAFKPCPASDAGFAIEPLRELMTYLQAAVGSGSLPGVVVLLARGDQLILNEAIGFSDIDRADPLTTDAVFRLYSMTKPLTAVAMLLLYEKGEWRFDDPVAKFLPEFENFAARDGTPLLRQPVLADLFTHTSGHGFGNTLEEIFNAVEEIDILGAKSLLDLIRRYAQLPALYEPGTHWNYSFGMDIQAAIVERITGQRYDLFLQEHLFAPLGMVDTAFMLTDAQRLRLVPGYGMDTETGRLRPGNRLEMQDLSFPIGGSSFHSTAADYARFLRMLLGGGTLNGTVILTPESVELMITNRLPDTFQSQRHEMLHYHVGSGNGHGMNGIVCVDPVAAGRPVGRGTYEWAGAHGTWFWADPENDIIFVGMTHRAMPHPELKPLSVVSQELVYRALQC